MNLQEFFAENPRVAIAFSGGVDSSYLLYAALHYGARARAYYVNSAFQPAFELEDARRLAGELNADMEVLPVDVLASETVTANPPDRCYHCKQVIFRTILAAAEADGFTVLLDGTNASDDAGDRPEIERADQHGQLAQIHLVKRGREEQRDLQQHQNGGNGGEHRDEADAPGRGQTAALSAQTLGEHGQQHQSCEDRETDEQKRQVFLCGGKQFFHDMDLPLHKKYA